VRHLMLALIFLCWAAPTYAATVDFGSGQVIGSFGAAVIAGNNGDDFVAHGPLTETNQYIQFNLNNCTFTVTGGTYTFNGSGTTGDWLDIIGDSNTFDLTDVAVTAYTNEVFVLSGNSNMVNHYTATNLGSAATTLIGLRLEGDSNTVEHISMTASVVPNTHVYGIYVVNSSNNTVKHAEVVDFQSAAAVMDAYGVFLSGSETSWVEDVLITGLDATDDSFGIVGSEPGATAGQLSTIQNVVIHSCSATDYVYAVRINTGSYNLINVVAYNLTGASGTRGFITLSDAGDPTRDYNYVANCFMEADVGIWQHSSGTQAIVAYNNIAYNCPTNGFQSYVGSTLTTDYNTAFSNGTDYSNWPTSANDWTGIDPVFVNAVTDNYKLDSSSPCIDTGTWITTRTTDVLRQPTSGSAQDRGAYEFQQSNTRNARSWVTNPPVVVTRNRR